MIRLVVEPPDGEPQRYTFPVNRLQIGRTPPNDLILADDSRKVSRVHAAIELRADGQVFIEDLGSVNGTLRNGMAVLVPVAVSAEDVVEIGPYRVRIDCETGLEAERREPEEPRALEPQLDVEVVAANLEALQQDVQVASADEVGRLELLYEVGMKLARANSIAEIQNSAASFLFRIAGVHRAALMLWDEQKQELQAPELIGRDGPFSSGPLGADPRRQLLSRTILELARRSNQPLHIRDPRSDSKFKGSRSIVSSGIQAALCAPLSLQGRFLGILYVDNLAMPDAFTTSDFQLFSVVTAQTGLALASAMTRNELLQREVERASLRRYVPPHVADVIEAAGEAQLSGQVQQVTVLFADIRGFTSLSEQLEARDVVLLLNEFFTAATEAVIACGGLLDKFIGDCVMALFGPPNPTGEDPARAMKAALRLHRAAERISAARRQRGLPGFAIGVGIHSGPAVVGNIGSAQRLQYTAIGDTVNVASRLAGKAAGRETIVSEAVAGQLSAAHFHFTSIGEVDLKGRNQRLHALLHRADCTTV